MCVMTTTAPARQGVPLRPDYAAYRERATQPIVRMACAVLLAHTERRPTREIIQRCWPRDETTALITKAASAEATTLAPGWARELLNVGQADVVSLLGPASAAPALFASGLSFQFAESAVASIGVPGIVASASGATFIAEGGAVPVRQADVSPSVRLAPKRLSTIIPVTREAASMSIPNLETLMRALLAENLGLAIDSMCLDDTATDGIRPAGLRDGIVATVASVLAVKREAMLEDIGNLIAKIAPAAAGDAIVLIASPSQAAALALWANVNPRYPILASGGLAAGTVVAIAARALASAVDVAPTFSVAKSATLVMADDAGQLGTGGVLAAGSTKSLWQTDSIGLRAILHCDWQLRHASGLAFVESVGW